MARVLELDPELGAELVAPVIPVDPGPWDPPAALPPSDDQRVGVLVVEGFLTREVRIAETTCAELLGRGDVLRPWEDVGAGSSIDTAVAWHVLEPVQLAVLDSQMECPAEAWPAVSAALVYRAVARAQTTAIALAISSITGLRIRLLALLWHLADRFGRVGPEGVIVRMPLTHQVIARLAGASRPSVSTTLKELEDDGAISRRPGFGYLLHGGPPDLSRLMAARRAAARPG